MSRAQGNRYIGYHLMAHWPEITEAAAADKYYSWEARHFGRVSDITKTHRHYWLKKLLERQLKEWDRG